jgi:hypothetical protein
MEIRLEDRLEHQLQRSLHNAVGGGWDAQSAQLAACLRDHLLAHRRWTESAGLEIISELLQHLSSTRPNGTGGSSIDTGRACTLVAPDPSPRHDEERRVTNEVVEIIESTAAISRRPLVQLRLHAVYS